jgi:beta-glucosidase
VPLINERIANLDDRKAARYLDLTSKFLDAKGKVSVELMPDVLHPNAAGYQV